MHLTRLVSKSEQRLCITTGGLKAQVIIFLLLSLCLKLSPHLLTSVSQPYSQNQEEKTQKFLLFMTCFFAWLSPTWLKGIITPVTERDQCWALIKVATGGPEESSSSCLWSSLDTWTVSNLQLRACRSSRGRSSFLGPHRSFQTENADSAGGLRQ